MVCVTGSCGLLPVSASPASWWACRPPGAWRPRPASSEVRMRELLHREPLLGLGSDPGAAGLAEAPPS